MCLRQLQKVGRVFWLHASSPCLRQRKEATDGQLTMTGRGRDERESKGRVESSPSPSRDPVEAHYCCAGSPANDDRDFVSNTGANAKKKARERRQYVSPPLFVFGCFSILMHASLTGASCRERERGSGCQQDCRYSMRTPKKIPRE